MKNSYICMYIVFKKIQLLRYCFNKIILLHNAQEANTLLSLFFIKSFPFFLRNEYKK